MRAMLTVAAGACLLALLGAPSARGSDLSQSDEEGVDYVRFEALPGRVNRLTITSTSAAGLTLRVSDAGASIHNVFGDVCRRRSRHAASCPVGANGGAVGIELGDRDDTAFLSGVPFVFDNVYDPAPPERELPDFQAAGDVGNDSLRLGAHASGGLYGGPGDDRLRAGPHGMGNLDGGPGDDILLGGGREDRVVAGSGNDSIGVAGGGADRVYCGTGFDAVRADAADRLVGCERVDR